MYGEKHICSSCGCKFYDLGKDEPECPKCKAIVKKPVKKTSKAKA